MTAEPYRVLFLCTRNSARSIMAEAILNNIGAPTFVGHSAGSRPAGAIDPRVLALLTRNGLPTDHLHSKSWDAFADGPPLDFVFTLCDDAAGETCPVWPGRPVTAHWPFPDPGSATGSDAEIAAFTADVFRQIHRRLSIFTALPLAKLDRMSQRERVAALADSRDTTG
mgnify:CR=1 FL=1